MKAVLQRVKSASVTINSKITGKIDQGILILLGVGHEDNEEDLEWILRKTLSLRLFDDEQGHVNLSLKEIQGQILVVSQFTLYASTKKGNRPSFTNAAHPEIAEQYYNSFIEKLNEQYDGKVATGVFGAMMDVELINDGPVTIQLDSRNKF